MATKSKQYHKVLKLKIILILSAIVYNNELNRNF